jgi:hypothetical protein
VSAAAEQCAVAVAESPKAFATTQARAALVGVTLYRTEDDRGRRAYIVSKWALTRELPTLEAVEEWLDRVVGRRP